MRLIMAVTLLLLLPAHGRVACEFQNSGTGRLDEVVGDSQLAATALLSEWTGAGRWARVHRSCVTNFPDFQQIARDAMDQGVACFERLRRQHPQDSSGARDNLRKLRELVSARGSVKIVCDETASSHWPGASAHATSSEDQAIGGRPHPVLSLNPSLRLRAAEDSERPLTREDLTKILFHESLHTLGHSHGVTVEYPYACDQCCFPSAEDNEVEAACRVCRRGYDSTSDPRYLDDLTAWAWRSPRPAIKRSALETLEAALATDQQRRALFHMLSFGGPGELFNSLLGEEFARRYAPLTGQEQNMVGMVGRLNSFPDHAPLLIPGRQGVQIFARLSLERDPAAARAYLDSLPANSFPESWPNASPGVSYVYGELRRQLYARIMNETTRLSDSGDSAQSLALFQSMQRVGLGSSRRGPAGASVP
jgi:hypothetical protein